MNVSFKKADSGLESVGLTAMMLQVLPDEDPFPESVWGESLVETWWILVDGLKGGLVSVEWDSAPGDTYESDSAVNHGGVYLILIGLLPRWQRRGIGKITMEWLKSEVARSEGYDHIVSNLREDNVASMRLHLSTGFKVVDSRPGYYSNPDCDSPVLRVNI